MFSRSYRSYRSYRPSASEVIDISSADCGARQSIVFNFERSANFFNFFNSISL